MKIPQLYKRLLMPVALDVGAVSEIMKQPKAGNLLAVYACLLYLQQIKSIDGSSPSSLAKVLGWDDLKVKVVLGRLLSLSSIKHPYTAGTPTPFRGEGVPPHEFRSSSRVRARDPIAVMGIDHIPKTFWKTKRFRLTWKRWIKFRKDIKHPLTESSAILQIGFLKKHSVDTAIAMIEQSLNSGWRGLFTLKSQWHKDGVLQTVIKEPSKVSKAIFPIIVEAVHSVTKRSLTEQESQSLMVIAAEMEAYWKTLPGEPSISIHVGKAKYFIPTPTALALEWKDYLIKRYQGMEGLSVQSLMINAKVWNSFISSLQQNTGFNFKTGERQ